MWRAVFYVVLFGAQPVLSDVPGPVSNRNGPCSSGFERLAANGLSRNLEALAQALPQIESPAKFYQEYQTRLEAWRSANPGRPQNIPMPENQRAVEWLKTTLRDLEQNPYYRYSNETTRRLTAAARRARSDELLREIESLEKRGYPTRDVLTVADDTLRLLDRIDVNSPIPKAFLTHFKEATGIEIDLSKDVLERLENLALISVREKAVGEDRLQLRANYENELIRTIENKLSSGGQSDLDVREIFVKFKHQLGFGRNANTNLAHNSVALEPLNGRNPIVFVVGEVSVRALAEASLFKIEIAGLIGAPARADGVFMNPTRFLYHDFNHMNGTRNDLISKKIVAMPAEEKFRILSNIDQIRDARSKALAENTLLSGLREFPASARPLFGDQKSEAAWIDFIKTKFKSLGDDQVTDSEARFAIKWWKENLPTE